MPKLLSFETGKNERIDIAIRTPEDAIAAVSVVSDVVEMAQQSLQTVLSVVAALSDSMYSALSRAEHKPSSAEVSFGLQFTAKGTIYVVESQAMASMNIKLTYAALS